MLYVDNLHQVAEAVISKRKNAAVMRKFERCDFSF